jgi:branched-chain amino acid transport system ATP-binding protein
MRMTILTDATGLTLAGVHSHYGKSHVLQGVELTVAPGEAVALLGRNGVGKTTTLKTIMGLQKASAGTIRFEGEDLTALPAHRTASCGIGYVPQGRRIFPQLSVMENLCVGLRHAPPAADLDYVFGRFPRLQERLRQPGGTLSGGEQQMLAIARALMLKPKLILFDEPTEGIMPVLVSQIRREIRAINRAGMSILLVEQSVPTALKLCDRIYIMEKGVVCFAGSSQALRNNPDALHRFLGVAV